RTLNYTEFILLKRFVSGISIQQIVNIDNIDIKKLYVHKLRLENKLGHSIHKIISNIL
ncbi:helix-turn-helix transcriptional regulator, partial [Salmonella enterica]|nr:helix-turn-helix transcriptional regulator [Salmonella enterica subsp. enterica serovar Heidelberg]EDH2463898.1 helix-turn-helix transcriptional regulator [Salmonella enterica]EDH2956508.1 helix-turn-helix transcriptional regulator [Salmonella enterica]EIK4177891.1 helix-turn-helix transcriptional regulator [Salmonella enterica]